MRYGYYMTNELTTTRTLTLPIGRVQIKRNLGSSVVLIRIFPTDSTYNCGTYLVSDDQPVTDHEIAIGINAIIDDINKIDEVNV